MDQSEKPGGRTRNDLTSGGILNKLLLVALPIMGTQLIQMSYNLTDMFWLGRLSTGAVAASGTSGMLMWLSMALMMVGRMGAEIGVSQHLGMGDPQTARRYSENSVMTAFALGAAYGLAMIVFRRQLVRFFNIQEPEVVAMAESYLALVGIGIPFSFVTSALVGTFNAAGNSRVPFMVNATGLAINMILDPIMIFPMKMNLAGAAAATVIAQVASCSMLMYLTLRGKRRPFERYHALSKPDLKILKRIVKWAAPICAESAFFTFTSMLTSRMVSPFGEIALAVSRVGSQIESLTWLIGGGFSTALVSFMGQNYGAGKWTRIRRGFNISIWTMTIYGIAVTALLLTAGGALFWVFLPDSEVMDLGVMFMRVLAFCQLPQCLEAVSSGTFRGTGRTLPGSTVSVLTNILRVALAAVGVRIWGVVGVWGAISLTAALRGFASLTWYLIEARKQPARDVPPITSRPGEAVPAD
ncbi:MAG: MATE family efflux transporter [Oscillospiraceae bacterium]|jgi:putative MATE family efflux protein|nr:MATE family efflux transporter [Oscillospiraceae bacterium]